MWFDYNNTNVLIENSNVHDNKPLHHDYEGEGLVLELDLGPVEVKNSTFTGNVGPQISIQSCRNINVHDNTVKGTYVDLRDWPRGDDYTDQNWSFAANTFDTTQIRASGGTWADNSAAVKQITFAGNTYTNAPATAFSWGSEMLSLVQAKTQLGVEPGK